MPTSRLLAKITADDRASARAREMATGDKTPHNLAYLLVGGAIVIGGFLLFGKLTLDSTRAGVVIGYLFNEAGAVTAYYYGDIRDCSSSRNG